MTFYIMATLFLLTLSGQLNLDLSNPLLVAILLVGLIFRITKFTLTIGGKLTLDV
jgi:hypothetical protein